MVTLDIVCKRQQMKGSDHANLHKPQTGWISQDVRISSLTFCTPFVSTESDLGVPNITPAVLGTEDAEMKFPFDKDPDRSKLPSLKTGGGQNRALHAMLANFLLPTSFNFIFFQILNHKVQLGMLCGPMEWNRLPAHCRRWLVCSLRREKLWMCLDLRQCFFHPWMTLFGWQDVGNPVTSLQNSAWPCLWWGNSA